MEKNKIQKTLISDLKKINAQISDVFLLCDYLNLEEYHDIDILCRKEDCKKMNFILKNMHYKTFCMYRKSSFYHKSLDSKIIRIHLHYDNFFNFLHINKIKSRIYIKDGIKIISKEDYFVSNLYKLVSRREDKYKKRILEEYNHINIKKAEEIGKEIFDYKSLNTFFRLFSERKYVRSFKTLKIKDAFASKIRKEEKLKIFDRIKIGLKKLFFPSPYIVIIGTDGSGKTSTTDKLIEILKDSKFKVAKELGTRVHFQFLPFNYLAKKVADKKVKKGQSQHAIRYSSIWVKTLSPLVYYIEYLLRYILSTFWKKRRYNFVISDRSFIDVIISPNTDTKIARFMYSILPKPDKVIFLYNDINVLEKRRPDHPAHDLLYQLNAYKKQKKLFDLQLKTDDYEQVLTKILESIL